jgi:hypothetical protein
MSGRMRLAVLITIVWVVGLGYKACVDLPDADWEWMLSYQPEVPVIVVGPPLLIWGLWWVWRGFRAGR